MKICLLMLCLFAALGGRAVAAPVDMNTWACQDWLDAGEEEQDLTVAWLRGYQSGRATSSLYDPASARADATALKRFCQAHLTVGVISAAGQWKH
jgi:hypothetical protein